MSRFYLMDTVYRVWTKFGQKSDDMEEMLPKRHRRNEVKCPITGEMTLNQTGIHERAWELILKGFAWEEAEAKKNAGKIWVAYRYQDVPRWQSLTTNYNDVLRIVEEGEYRTHGIHSEHFAHHIPGVLEMAGIKHNDRSSQVFQEWAGGTAESRHAEGRWWDTREWLFDPPENMPSWDGLDFIFVNEEQREWVKLLWSITQKALDRCAVANAENGMGFLRQMAAGETSIDDFNKVTARIDDLKE